MGSYRHLPHTSTTGPCAVYEDCRVSVLQIRPLFELSLFALVEHSKAADLENCARSTVGRPGERSSSAHVQRTENAHFHLVQRKRKQDACPDDAKYDGDRERRHEKAGDRKRWHDQQVRQ